MSGKINWINPATELPKAGDIVATITNHKGKWPESFEITFGEVEWCNENKSCRVTNYDWNGYGATSVYLKHREGCTTHDPIAEAWAPAGEFNMPEWARLEY